MTSFNQSGSKQETPLGLVRIKPGYIWEPDSWSNPDILSRMNHTADMFGYKDFRPQIGDFQHAMHGDELQDGAKSPLTYMQDLLQFGIHNIGRIFTDYQYGSDDEFGPQRYWAFDASGFGYNLHEHEGDNVLSAARFRVQKSTKGYIGTIVVPAFLVTRSSYLSKTGELRHVQERDFVFQTLYRSFTSCNALVENKAKVVWHHAIPKFRMEHPYAAYAHADAQLKQAAENIHLDPRFKAFTTV